MLTFLEVNGIRLNVTDEELVEIGLSLAQSEMKYEELLVWIKATKPEFLFSCFPPPQNFAAAFS